HRRAAGGGRRGQARVVGRQLRRAAQRRGACADHRAGRVMTIAPRPGILDIAPYVGGESKAAGVNRVVRLASNENPLGASPLAAAAYEAEKTQLHRYPDGGATVLRAAIGEAESLDAARIVCGAGSDELI